MFIGVAAVPCGGPVIALVAALVGQTRDTAFGLFAFSSMGLGLGLPVGILIMSGSLKVLARPGEWMVTVKHILGLAVIASGIYFVGFTLKPKIGADALSWVWMVYLLGAGFYLLVFDHTGRARAGILGLKSVVALAAAFYAATLLPSSSPAAPSAVRWESFDIPKLEAALGHGSPVLIDFRADWCAKCVEIEKKTFSDPRVQPSLSRMTLFRADMTNSTPAAWNDRFRLGAIPVVLFYDGRGNLVRRFETFFDVSEFRTAAGEAGVPATGT
jgi:thiol:disulfide interchange protein DsbD